MGVTTLRCWLCGRSRLFLFVSLALVFASLQSAKGQANGTVDGCTRCPDEQYFDIVTGRCEQCTTCLHPLEERSPCAYELPDLCDIYGQFDRLCCEAYEYEAYGDCYLDCRNCEVTARCKEGLTECDCPSDRYGNLCQYIVPTPRPTTPAAPGESTHQTTTEEVVPLETWQFALIGLGIVVGVVGFAALCAVGSFCQYNRRSLRHVSKPTVSSAVLDSRSSSTATVSSNSSSDSTHYLIAPPHTRIYPNSQRPAMNFH